MNGIERMENENKKEATIESLGRLPAAAGEDKHMRERILCVCLCAFFAVRDFNSISMCF